METIDLIRFIEGDILKLEQYEKEIYLRETTNKKILYDSFSERKYYTYEIIYYYNNRIIVSHTYTQNVC